MSRYEYDDGYDYEDDHNGYDDHGYEDHSYEDDRYEYTNNGTYVGDDQYSFQIVNGQVTAVYEYEHGRAQAERIDWNETYVYQNGQVIKTEQDGRYVETTVYADTNGDGYYTKISESYAPTTGTSGTSGTSSASSASTSSAVTSSTVTAPTSVTGTSYRAEGYQFTIVNGQVQSATEIEHGYAREATNDWNTTWSVDGSNVLKIEDHSRYVEISVYADSNGDGLYTKVLEYYDTVSAGTSGGTSSTTSSATSAATPTVPVSSLVSNAQEGLVTVYGDEGVADDVYRLYEAAFNRASDHDGLGYWVSKVQQGVSLTQVAGEFVASQEFATRYGESLDDGSFVDALYSNVLGRLPDAEGHDYWTAKLAANQLTQAQVLESFANSAENVANVADDLAAGIQYSNFVG